MMWEWSNVLLEVIAHRRGVAPNTILDYAQFPTVLSLPMTISISPKPPNTCMPASNNWLTFCIWLQPTSVYGAMVKLNPRDPTSFLRFVIFFKSRDTPAIEIPRVLHGTENRWLYVGPIFGKDRHFSVLWGWFKPIYTMPNIIFIL